MREKWQSMFNNNFRRHPTARKSLPWNKTHSPSGQARYLDSEEPNSSYRTPQAGHLHIASSLLTTRLQITEFSFHISNSGAMPNPNLTPRRPIRRECLELCIPKTSSYGRGTPW